MSQFTCTVTPARAGQTVEAVLRAEFHFSGSLWRSLKWRAGALRRNGARARANERVAAGDILAVTVDERRPPSGAVLPCAVKPDIVFEDEHLLVLNKPAGLSMHDKSRPGAPTLAGAVRAYLGAEHAAHFVNRLDRGTSGLLLAAKSGYLHDRLRRALHTGALYREYRGIAAGVPPESRGAVTLPLGPAEGAVYRQCVRPDGKEAYTEYEVLFAAGGCALLRLIPHTGRTHQLRVHMAALGCPLLGDTLYGAPPGTCIDRPALHAYLLRFTHPMTGATLCFTAPLPPDMAALPVAGGESPGRARSSY